MLSRCLRKAFSTQSGVPKDLAALGIRNKQIFRNLGVPQLYEKALQQKAVEFNTPHDTISSTGALCAYSGLKTGRSPKDKRIVKDEKTANDIWWGDINIPIEPSSYKLVEERVVDYLNARDQIFVVDGYAGWDPKYRLKVTVVCARPYHALFMKNMLIRAPNDQLERDFANGADFYVLNGGEFTNSALVPGANSKTCIAVNFSQNRLAILGSQYAGEMKKGIFGVMHYLMPKKGVLSLHASANEGKNGDVTLLFGLSGTGKTTLSADPHRALIGDDEHCWTEEGVFNIEGGCYAKAVNLTREKEPEIYDAIRFGSILENVILDPNTRAVDFTNISITENTRVTYPLEFIPGAKDPAIGGHPKNIFFLTCDAFGVLPPVAHLTSAEAMYHFISGYTAKVAGTEIGIKEPVATFSACFGEVFLPLHPTLYAEMLAEKMKKHKCSAWLINTGWSGGKYGVGQRMSLKYTRAIIDAIHDGKLQNVEYSKMDVFGIDIPKSCPGVPSEILNPRNTWQNKDDYDKTLRHLAGLFTKNFQKYADKASADIKNAGPKV